METRLTKILIADDEPLARDSIVALLENNQKSQHLIQARDGEEALELAWSERPDMIFLDIQMPRMTGIEVATELPEDSVVVFTTAYDEYAVKAFELNAVDYLLKPFKNARFFEAMARAEKKLQEQQFVNPGVIATLATQIQQSQKVSYKSRLVIKEPKRFRIINVDHIKFITGAGNYAELHLFNDKAILYRETLSKLEEQLDSEIFRRIHRSTIVRISTISELLPNYQGDHTVLLTSGEELVLSRRYKDKIQDLLS